MTPVIPELDRYSCSWVVTRRETGEVIGVFYERQSIMRFDGQRVLVETSFQYLTRKNHG